MLLASSRGWGLLLPVSLLLSSLLLQWQCKVVSKPWTERDKMIVGENWGTFRFAKWPVELGWMLLLRGCMLSLAACTANPALPLQKKRLFATFWGDADLLHLLQKDDGLHCNTNQSVCLTFGACRKGLINNSVCIWQSPSHLALSSAAEKLHIFPLLP